MNKLLIDGRWVDALDGETIDVIDPCSGEAFTRIARGRAADVDLAVAAARRAVEGAWGSMTATERGRILQRLGQLILDHGEELADLEARDTGKPMSVARADAGAVARYFEFYGGAADKVHGQTIPYLSGYNVSVVRIPHGVTAHIIPWNYPAQMMGRTLAPALAMGNAAVVKPSEDACLTVLKLGELALQAGLPPGALNIVTGYGAEAGAALTAHPGINFATFTGSPEVGIRSSKPPRATMCPACWNWAENRRKSYSTTRTWRRPRPSSSGPSSRTRARPAPPAAACWCNRAFMTASSISSRPATPS